MTGLLVAILVAQAVVLGAVAFTGVQLRAHLREHRRRPVDWYDRIEGRPRR